MCWREFCTRNYYNLKATFMSFLIVFLGKGRGVGEGVRDDEGREGEDRGCTQRRTEANRGRGKYLIIK